MYSIDTKTLVPKTRIIFSNTLKIAKAAKNRKNHPIHWINFKWKDKDKLAKLHHRKIEPLIQDPDPMNNIHSRYRDARRLSS
jgi:hypothetical protein